MFDLTTKERIHCSLVLVEGKGGWKIKHTKAITDMHS